MMGFYSCHKTDKTFKVQTPRKSDFASLVRAKGLVSTSMGFITEGDSISERERFCFGFLCESRKRLIDMRDVIR